MKPNRSIASFVAIVLAVTVGLGMITGCGGGESDTSQSEQPAMSDEQTMTEQQSAMAQTFEATLQGSNEVPAVTTDASGSVTVTLEGDSIHVQGKFSGLSSDYIASHIHEGGPDENGSAIIPLEPMIGSDKRSGSWDATYMVEESQISALKAGNLYINVHSAENKPGEIRGQLTGSSGM
ncbi:MAG: CHRD domain-containing protein [Balneolaceae bacterium]|nr:CHRD domain-containing protein [Balneolaceae bacterium]